MNFEIHPVESTAIAAIVRAFDLVSRVLHQVSFEPTAGRARSVAFPASAAVAGRAMNDLQLLTQYAAEHVLKDKLLNSEVEHVGDGSLRRIGVQG